MDEYQTYSADEIEQLLSLSEELQTENEQQREQIEQQAETIRQLSADKQALQQTCSELPELQTQIQQLLSNNQRLKSKVVQQAELIATLNESDKQLKAAAEMKKNTEELLKTKEKELKQKENHILSVNQKERKRIEKLSKQATELQNEANELHKKAIKEMWSAENVQLKIEQGISDNWKRLVRWVDVWVWIVCFHAFMATIGILSYSTKFRSDIRSSGTAIAAVFDWLYDLTHTISHGITRFISNSIGYNIAYWAFRIVLFIVSLFVLIIICRYLYLWHKTYCPLIVTLWLTEIYFVAVMFAIEFINYNVIAIYLVLMLLYMILCCAVQLKQDPFKTKPIDLFSDILDFY